MSMRLQNNCLNLLYYNELRCFEIVIILCLIRIQHSKLVQKSLHEVNVTITECRLIENNVSNNYKTNLWHFVWLLKPREKEIKLK
jgi:hypothetical protein